jgi:AcrR family transcriptional regulator
VVLTGDLTGDAVLADEPRAAATDRITAGALACIARWGMAKTTLDDIAREAGCSRATIYRLYPGGKQTVFDAMRAAELARLLAALAVVFDGTESLADLLAVALSGAVAAIQENQALQYLMAHEPGQVLAHLSFDALDPLLAEATAFGAPYLERYVDPVEARRTAEWMARVIVSYGIEPCEHDLADPEVAARFVRTFVLPGLADARHPDPRPDLIPTT